MKRLFLYTVTLTLLCLVNLTSNAQQIPLYTQYIFNNFVYNPAIAGTYNYYQIRTNSRVQWVGITDHPVTNVLSVYGPSKEKDMGYGGSLFIDNTGPTSRLGLSGSYAYNVAINEQVRLSMGLSVGILQYKVSGSDVELWDAEADPMQNVDYTETMPDASVGVYLYSYNYHVGFSATQLLNNRMQFFNYVDMDTTTDGGISKLKSHFFLSGGYRYFINREWSVEPNAVFKYAHPSPIQLDFTLKGIYKNMVWGGLSVRTSDAFSLLLGYIHEKQYYFGYSYDFTFSALSKYNSGTHEITIGYKFNAIK